MIFYWLVSRAYSGKFEVLSVFKSGRSWRQNGTSPFASLCSADGYLGKGSSYIVMLDCVPDGENKLSWQKIRAVLFFYN